MTHWMNGCYVIGRWNQRSTYLVIWEMTGMAVVVAAGTELEEDVVFE